MILRFSKRKPHTRPGTSARQERRRKARQRLGASIDTTLAHAHQYDAELLTAMLARMRREYATLGRLLGIAETVDA